MCTSLFLGATLANEPTSCVVGNQENSVLCAHGGKEGFLPPTEEQSCAFTASLKALEALHGTWGDQTSYQGEDITANLCKTQTCLQD